MSQTQTKSAPWESFPRLQRGFSPTCQNIQKRRKHQNIGTRFPRPRAISPIGVPTFSQEPHPVTFALLRHKNPPSDTPSLTNPYHRSLFAKLCQQYDFFRTFLTAGLLPTVLLLDVKKKSLWSGEYSTILREMCYYAENGGKFCRTSFVERL